MKNNVSLELKLFRTIKQLLYEQGQCVWDLLLYKNDYSSDDNNQRYVNFRKESVKHFNLGAFFNEQVGANYPLLTVGFTQLKSSACFPKFSIDFDSYFSTVSPSDCKDEQVDICNTPECMLAYKSAMVESILCLLECFDANELDLDDCYKQNFNIIGQPIISNFRIIKEVVWFTVSLDVSFKNC